MRDYAELVKALNEISNKTSCYYCHGESLDCKTAGCYISDAADAIEELLAHACCHYHRNVHDRGDDSFCDVLNTEPPKEVE